MNTQTKITFVDTAIIPDRNAGIGSLLWDMQDPMDTDRDGQPLLGPEFAFIDVGVSRAKVSAALKTLLAGDLGMNVDYAATELPDAVPYTYVIISGDRAEKIRRYLSRMISSKQTTREVINWHYVVDYEGKVSSLSYSYKLHGNEVWESYYMGNAFMLSGKNVEFLDPALDKILAPDVLKIETLIDLEREKDSDPSRPGPVWNEYRIEKNPLEEGLDEFGITLQKTNVPQRIGSRQNVLYLGNVLNHYPKDERANELIRITANMQDGDIVIVQGDELEKSIIEVISVKGQGAQKILERVSWIDTNKFEIRKFNRGTGSWQQLYLKPGLGRIVSYLINCLGRKVTSTEWRQESYKLLVRQNINQVFGTFFRAMPVEETLRIAIREALRRLPSSLVPKGIPVFKGDEKDAYGSALQLDTSPIVTEIDLVNMLMASADVERTLSDKS